MLYTHIFTNMTGWELFFLSSLKLYVYRFVVFVLFFSAYILYYRAQQLVRHQTFSAQDIPRYVFKKTCAAHRAYEGNAPANS